jgi:hypothetical protein
LRIFKTKLFARFARGQRITDEQLIEAVARVARGLIDADLKGGLIKQRVARRGQGRSGGFRVLVAFQSKERSVFLFGFAKNDRENIDDKELANVRDVAASWLAADSKMIAKALAEGLLIEVKNDS